MKTFVEVKLTQIITNRVYYRHQYIELYLVGTYTKLILKFKLSTKNEIKTVKFVETKLYNN